MDSKPKSENNVFRRWFVVAFTLLSIAVSIIAVVVTFISTFGVTNREEIENKLILYSSIIKNDVEERLGDESGKDIAEHIFNMLSNIPDNDLIDTIYFSFNDGGTTYFKELDGAIVSGDDSEPIHKESLYDTGYATWIDTDSGKCVSSLVGLFSPDGELFGAIQMTYVSNSFTELYTNIVWLVAAVYIVFALIVILFTFRRKKAVPRNGGASE